MKKFGKILTILSGIILVFLLLIWIFFSDKVRDWNDSILNPVDEGTVGPDSDILVLPPNNDQTGQPTAQQIIDGMVDLDSRVKELEKKAHSKEDTSSFVTKEEVGKVVDEKMIAFKKKADSLYATKGDLNKRLGGLATDVQSMRSKVDQTSETVQKREKVWTTLTNAAAKVPAKQPAEKSETPANQ